MNYQTLQGHDLLLPERQFGVMMKNGYSSRNREWTNTLGFGVSNDPRGCRFAVFRNVAVMRPKVRASVAIR